MKTRIAGALAGLLFQGAMALGQSVTLGFAECQPAPRPSPGSPCARCVLPLVAVDRAPGVTTVGSKPSPPPSVNVAASCMIAACEPARPGVWFRSDYLLWWARRGPTPALVATGPETDPFPGVLGQPGTRVLFGDDGLRFGAFSGLRLAAGFWADREESFGFEAEGFFTETRSSQFRLAGDARGQPFFGIPFVDATDGQPNLFFVSQSFANPAFNNNITGAVDIYGGSRLWGWETNAVANLAASGGVRTDLIAGFRALGLDESLTLGETLASLTPAAGNLFFGGAPVFGPAVIHTADVFQASNRFYGPQVGTRVSWQRGACRAAAGAKVALGVTQELAVIDGRSTLLVGGGAVQTLPGGVLATPTNSGRHFRDQFAVVPELRLDLGYQVTPRLLARLGYTFLYWSDVARPGALVDPVINPAQVPSDFAYAPGVGPARPAFRFQDSDYWAMGLNLGLEYRY